MRLLSALALAALLAGCSLRHAALEQMAGALAEGGAAFASDDDPELVRAAAPVTLKLIEAMLEQRPADARLHLAAASGFAQYAYAFVQQDADEAEAVDLQRALALSRRARLLYARARDHGLHGLALGDGPEAAGLAFWTGMSWAALIALSKDEPEMLADLPRVDALVHRALELDEGYGAGALQTFLIAYEVSHPAAAAGSTARARGRFARAMQLSGGRDAAPLVALAESVCVREQQKAEFDALLERALAIDTRQPSPQRLANLVAQRRARWLLARRAELFLE